MKKYRKLACILVGSMAVSLCAGCIGTAETVTEEAKESSSAEGEAITEEPEEVQKADTQEINQVHLRDKDSLYENDDETSVVTMYLTVSRGNSSENTDHTWEEINSYSAYDYEEMGIDRVSGWLHFCRWEMKMALQREWWDMEKTFPMPRYRSVDRLQAEMPRKTTKSN